MGVEPARLARLGAAIGIVAAAVGAFGIFGSVLGEPLLASFVPDGAPMAPHTGLMLLLGGIAVAARRGARGRAVAVVVGVVILVTAAVTLFEYIAAIDLGIDRLLAPRSSSAPEAGRMSPPTAVALALYGGALLWFDSHAHGVHPREIFASTAGVIAYAALVGHAFGVDPLYRFERGSVSAVALPSAVAILLIGVAMFLERPTVGAMRMLTSSSPGGATMRRLGFAAVAAPFLVGLLVVTASDLLGVLDWKLIAAVLTTAMVPIALAVVALTIRPMDRAFAALEASRTSFRALVEHAPDGIFLADTDGRYTEVNVAGCALLGWNRDQIIGKAIDDLIPPEDAPRLAKARTELLEGHDHVAEWRLRRQDGSYVPVEVNSRLLADGRWQGFVRDLTARSQADQEVRRWRNRLEGLIASASDAIVSIDSDQRITIFNERAEETFGFSRDQVLGKPIEMLIPERFRAAHPGHVQRFAQEENVPTRASHRTPVIGLRANGEEFPAEAAISKLHDASGTIFTAIIRDVSARVRLENELLESRNFLQDVLDSSTEYSIVAHDLDLHIQTWNEGARRLYGYSREEVLGKRIDVLAPRDQLDLVRQVHQEALERGVAQRVVTRRRADGSEFVARIVVTRRMDRDGKPSGYLLISKDITLEERILGEQRLFSAVGEVLSSTLDRTEMVRRVVRQSVPFLGDVCAVLFFEDDEPQLQGHAADTEILPIVEGLNRYELPKDTPLWRAYETGVPVLVAEVPADMARSVATSGEQLELLERLDARSVAAAPLIARDRCHGAIFVATRGSSRRRYGDRDVRTLEELGRRMALAIDNAVLHEQVRRNSAEKDILLKEVHHRVKNNLQVISSLFYLQGERARDAALKRLLDESRGRIQSIALVHEQLYRAVNLAEIDFVEYLTQLAAELGRTYGATDRGIDIRCSGKSVLLDVGRAVPCGLLVTELISNAIKHAFPDGRRGRVDVAVARRNGELLLEIKDDGIGMPLDMDWRASESLGLQLVQSLLKQLRGQIEVDRHAGTRFSIRVPAQQPDSQRAEGAWPPS